ncbi:MAG: glycosyltransferase [Planctomycetaceae bacterium]
MAETSERQDAMNPAGENETITTTTECVSVIIPCYNQAQFLAPAVESVLSQASVAVDVIIVDDGSRDGTSDVAAQFGDSVRLIRQENCGLSAARNRGMREAHGDFVLFLDSDDVLLEGALDRFVSVARNNPEADVFYSGARLIDSGGEPLCDVIPGEMGPDPLTALLLANRISAPGAVVLRRRVWDKVGEFDPQLGASEDWDYWIRLAAHGATFIRIPEPLLGYRQHAESLSRKYFTLVEAVRSVSAKHRAVARRPWRRRLARHAGRRVMHYFCVNRALRPAVARMIRAGEWRQACATLTRAVFQDWEAPLFFLVEYWVLALAARLRPTVQLRETTVSDGPAVDQQ